MEEVLGIAADWDHVRAAILTEDVEPDPSELEELRTAVFDEAVYPAKEFARDAALWRIGRSVARRYPNVVINGAIVLQALNNLAKRISPVLKIIDTLQPSRIATEHQERLVVERMFQAQLADRIGRLMTIEDLKAAGARERPSYISDHDRPPIMNTPP